MAAADTCLDGGFSIDLTHHALHARGSRLYGFTWHGAPSMIVNRSLAAAAPRASRFMSMVVSFLAVLVDDCQSHTTGIVSTVRALPDHALSIVQPLADRLAGQPVALTGQHWQRGGRS